MGISKPAVKNLLRLYKDQMVIVVLKNLNVAIPNEEGSLDIAAMLTGLLVDADQDFIYVADETGAVKTIPMDSIGVLEDASGPEMGLEFPSEEDEVH